ncbi:uncharacterized protein EDB93DRAFT_1250884 [Suillus bovinus]|uniref:uncharacterized protein n=1 Tax=Suillus bovinus TaxID=48563 RepID=UPI001B87F2BD|nr:uncharacterized protein EDB93DRAFT_1250884 [Suillus bovinus]KAG2146603.1 hypothetical protein EDB93DRAFT_1250884 [Suillus bovinus]
MDIFHAGREQDDNNDNPVADDNVDEDEQPNNMPFNVSEFPRQLAAGDGHVQEDVRTALYQQQAESGRDYVTNFNTTPPRTVTLTKLRTMYRNKDSLGAMGLLSGRHRLVIGNDHTIPKDGPNVVPRVGPHYIDHTLYVGNRKGLDAAIPKIRADHNWQVTLDLANTHRLWPDSNVACLPFNPIGRMVYIGTRLQEQLWLAVVPTTFFEPNHPDNARAAYPALNAPSTALTQRHALMIVMFIAHAFTEMFLQDIHCRERYPVPLTRAAVKESTDILIDENHRRIILRLEDFKRLSHILNTGWDDWVVQAPPSWKEDNFLTNNAPVGVTIRYGQNQPLLVHGALDDERRNWDNDRNYTHIRQFTFSLATHISYLDVREWREVPNFQNEGGIIYDKSSDDPMRTEVNLEGLPLLDEDGFEISVYNEQGFRVPRRAPVQFSTCGALLDLHSVHELFRSDDDAHGNTRNKAHFDVYPLACTKTLGNIQSRSLISNFLPHLGQIDGALRPHLVGEDDNRVEGDVVPGDLIRGASVLHGISCQIYNELSHRVRDEAKFHPVQLGMISAALSGTTTKDAARRRWTRRLQQCNHSLPHERFNDKVSGDNQPQALRFENTYTLDVYRMNEEFRNGSDIYDHVIRPLLKTWSHPTVLSPIKDTIVVFQPNRIPSLFAWATFPLTALLETIWEMHSNTLVDGAVIDPCIIEFTSMVERALNFSHTGNARVLCRRLMDRSWISLGIIHDGLPSISDAFVAYGSLNTGKLVIRQELWPVDQDTRRPLTSSRRTQELTYSKEYYEAYEARFTIRHAINFLPANIFPHINNHAMRIACYAAEIAFRVYFDDVKHLVHAKVLHEIEPALEGDDRHARRVAKDRQTALGRWLDEDYPLSYSGPLAYLLRAVVDTNDGNTALQLTSSHLGNKPISFFVDNVIKQSTTNLPRRQPPFIAGGNFLAVMRVAIEEMKRCAGRDSIQGKDVDFFVSEAVSHVCESLKINHIPWTANPTLDRGNHSSTIVHNVWLNLGATGAPKPVPSASFLTRRESIQVAVLNSSAQVQLRDSRADWSANEVRLNDFASVLHKVVLPIEWNTDHASLPCSSQYIADTYNYVRTIFNPSIPLHRLALIVSIAFSGLVPCVYAPPLQKARIPTGSYDLALYTRNLEWVSRPKKGGNNAEPFITMVTTFIIALYDPQSPTSSISDVKEWVRKHSNKGITTLALCRLGLAKACTTRALFSSKWGIDIQALTSSEIAEKHEEVIRLLKTGGAYGGYDAIMYLMGKRTADHLAKNHYVKARALPTLGGTTSHFSTAASTSSSSSPLSFKRTMRDWDDDSRVTTASADEISQKKKRS